MSVADKDLELWEKWNKRKSQANLSKLLDQMTPIIKNAVRQYSGSLSPVILEAEAKIQAVKAFHSYNPSMGTKLSTHVINYLQKINRLVYKHQELYSVPEDRRIKYHTFDSIRSHLKDQLDRDPTGEELADNLKWSRSEVNRYLSEDRRELSESMPISNDADFFRAGDSAMTAYIYNDLNPTEKVLFEHTTGYGGKPILATPQLLQKLNMTQGQLSYMKKNLVDKIERARY
jgi:DNA-directed RNA polymerase specialized sigma subunit